MNLLTRLLSRRQLLFALIILPILPFGSRDLICRSDPIVVLSNGITLVIGANVASKIQDVQEVHYVLHVPVGVDLVSSTPTPFWKKTQETFEFYADQAPGQYQVTTVVHTKKGDNDIVADTSVTSAAGVQLGYYSAAGDPDQTLTVSFSA